MVDGEPFTAEDFRYAWEDIVILNEDLRRRRPAARLMAGGKPPNFEVIDELTVRYTWAQAEPDFLPALAAPAAGHLPARPHT